MRIFRYYIQAYRIVFVIIVSYYTVIYKSITAKFAEYEYARTWVFARVKLSYF